MTSGQKTAFSFLASMALLALFVFVANPKLNLLKNLEKQFYSQVRVREKVVQLDELSKSFDSYISNILGILETNEDAYCKSSAVLSYLEYNPSEKVYAERRSKTTQLFQTIPTLNGIRIVDLSGRLQYSSFENTDVSSGKDSSTKIYARYPTLVDTLGELPLETVAPTENNSVHKIILDNKNHKLIISVPMFKADALSSVLLCYFDYGDIQKYLSLQDSLYGENIKFIGDKGVYGGLVLGLPSKSVQEFEAPIVLSWKNKQSDNSKENVMLPEKILAMEDGRYWEILHSKKSEYINVSGVYTSDLFQLSNEIIILIYIAIGLSLFLIIFLLFNIKGDSMVMLKKKVRRIQYGVIKEYIDNKEEIQWEKVVDKIQKQKNELSKEILKASGVRGKKKTKELDALLSQNWEDIFAVITPKAKAQNDAQIVHQELGFSKDDLRQMLEEILKETKLNVNVANVVASAENTIAERSVKSIVPEVEEIEEVEELTDDVEEIEEVEELTDDVEEVEEVEELTDDVEEIEEVEELIDDVEEIEEVEELIDDVEEVEDAEDSIDPIALAAAFSSPVNYEYKESNDTYIEKGKFPTVENLFADIISLGSEIIPQNPESVIKFKFKVYELNEEINTAQPIDEISSVSETPEITEAEVSAEVTEAIDTVDLTTDLATEPDTEIEELSDQIGELEDISNDMFISNNYFAMTKFGANTNNVIDLDDPEATSIVEEEGVYSISPDLQYTDVIQDPVFKELVDSVLK